MAFAARVERKEGRNKGRDGKRSINGHKWPSNPKFCPSLAIPLNNEGTFETRKEQEGRER